ncbi:hypothetical protein [Vitiosangium sp. GDMCC 1.1324]|uniref:hypothetical protein n=1 Tax=Vitiosangium sp. (strain GDMCC 1.1324) TaxID=2138576 RepID=UPI000D38A472|nr:hypothetical protein [Vitiosangium sp. GDMCC 1.1324]PTL84856.1 hypothetical protein DAT35_07315 [Vitiosangium sp. GDMCC 1.1324]
MTRGLGVIRAGSVLALACLGLACWLYEVLAVRGWDGLAWLYPFPLSAIPACLFVALASWLPVCGQGTSSRWKVGLYLVLAWSVALGSFTLARDAVFGLLGSRTMGMSAEEMRTYHLTQLGWLFAALVLASVGMGVGLRWLGFPVRRRTVLLLALALVAVPPASLLTLQVVPALHGQRDFIHAVKMGYPVFWTVLLVAGAVALGRQPVHGR